MEDEGSKACSQKSIADELDWGAAGELGLLSLIIHMRTHTHTRILNVCYVLSSSMTIKCLFVANLSMWILLTRYFRENKQKS